MIRKGTILWVFILMCSAFGVFQVKYRVQDLRKDLTEINRQLEQEHDAIHILKAEWSYLNQPDRLRNIVHRHLPNLDAVTVTQISRSVDKPVFVAETVKQAVPEEEENSMVRMTPASPQTILHNDSPKKGHGNVKSVMFKQKPGKHSLQVAENVQAPLRHHTGSVPPPLEPILTSLRADER